MFLKSKGFLRNTGHWKKHGFEEFSGFEKRDNIARWSARNRRATRVTFFKIRAHYGKNAPLHAHRALLFRAIAVGPASTLTANPTVVASVGGASTGAPTPVFIAL